MSNLAKLLLAVLLLVGMVLLWSWMPIAVWVEQLRLWILGLGLTGVLVFVVAYVVLTVVMAPVSLLTLSAGLAYGAWGFPLVVVSATLAATVAFLLGRYLAKDRVSVWIDRDARLRAINQAVTNEGWRVVGLLRLSPLVPFGLQNYLLSVTSVGLIPFIIATAIGMMPAIALFVYIGVVGQAMSGAGTLQWILIGAGLISSALIVWFVGKRANALLVASAAIDQEATK